MSSRDELALTPLIAGGLSWGLIGLFNIDLVSSVFGGLGRLVVILVGWAAVYQALNWSRL